MMNFNFSTMMLYSFKRLEGRLYYDVKKLCKSFTVKRAVRSDCATHYHTSSYLNAMSHSSKQWIFRQQNDPYVEKAKQHNYRCRSAFKLLEINEKYTILTPGLHVVDCGAAPGSWTQVAVHLTNANGTQDAPIGKVYAIDILPMHPIKDAVVLGNMDFTTSKAQTALLQLMNNVKADVILSDMAPNATGVKEMDHENIVKLVYHAMRFALQHSHQGGVFLCKIWDGGRTHQLHESLAKFYKTVQNVKPPASRSDSSEIYILARNFKGLKDT